MQNNNFCIIASDSITTFSELSSLCQMWITPKGQVVPQSIPLDLSLTSVLGGILYKIWILQRKLIIQIMQARGIKVWQSSVCNNMKLHLKRIKTLSKDTRIKVLFSPWTKHIFQLQLRSIKMMKIIKETFKGFVSILASGQYNLFTSYNTWWFYFIVWSQSTKTQVKDSNSRRKEKLKKKKKKELQYSLDYLQTHCSCLTLQCAIISAYDFCSTASTIDLSNCLFINQYPIYVINISLVWNL